jgi:dienelactone hydrolase
VIAHGVAALAALTLVFPTPYLPEPTGHSPVGMTNLHLVDHARADPWAPGTDRELMVSVFYPAASTRGEMAAYLTPVESAALLDDDSVPADVPRDLLSTTVTNAIADARPAGRPHSLPLVVLSPGYTKPRATLGALAEDLAGHGYVVAVIGHTGENTGTSFPDGRFVGCTSCEVDHEETFWAKLTHGRAADVSFVLDELTGRHPAWRGARLIDERRIAMGGHSAGGGSAPAALAGDRRIRSGFDIDGGIHVPVEALDRPFLFLGKQPPDAPVPGCTNPEWQAAWDRMHGWKRWLEVAGAQHASFTDIGLLGEQLGLDSGARVGAERVGAITRAYVRAFLDQSLRGKPQPLLAHPSRQYPEVAYCR